MFKNISLRIQMTILTTLILVIVSVILTVTSVYNVNQTLVAPMYSALTTAPSFIESGQYLDSTNPYMYEIDQSIEFMMPVESIVSLSYAEEVIAAGTSSFRLSAFGSMILIIIVAAGFIYYVLGKFLNPVKQLSDEIELINEKRLSQRLIGFNTSGELQELSHSFNMMLDRLNRAFESQKRFSSDAAHELKTPLTVLKTKLDVLEMDANVEIDDYQNFVEVAKKQTERMINLVDHLFILSAQQDYELSDEVYLDYVFIDILEDLKTAIESKNLTVEYEPCDITMTSNQIMLTHAFSNLIQNAIKYNHDKGSIAIRTSVEEQSLIVEVIDTGIGIPKEQSEHIFNAFYCVDPSRSRKFGGAGLGLAITKDVIERHQGTIEYLPNPDGGSIFKVILPI
ncbi:HAMP domain-containing sensor histidine kinase [Turicibacter sanguinis]|uniref:sensor histidine kinase n=1 Tax=Turicibacter sanguinis TaxID=154288 RepID=UPI00232F784D|nr:HAMP domain-containing sensor histidine kinase [Turicibacter sanguinis]MDB8541008.1 HAMP domain-containing sensor histidine kinase [Turicibacter sanguinis]